MFGNAFGNFLSVADLKNRSKTFLDIKDSNQACHTISGLAWTMLKSRHWDTS